MRPPRVPDRLVLILAAECRVLTRDVLVLGAGISYNLADRTLVRLSGRRRPYLRRSHRRVRLEGGRSGQWFTLRDEGATRLRALGSPWPDEVLRSKVAAIKRLHQRNPFAKPLDVSRVERAAMMTALFLGGSALVGGFTVGDGAPGQELGLTVSQEAVRGVIGSGADQLRSGVPGETGGTMPVEPLVHLRLRVEGRASDVGLLVYALDGDAPGRRDALVSGVVRACALAPSLESGCAIGPHPYGDGMQVHILVWLPSHAEELAFNEAVGSLASTETHRIWSMNGETVPLAGCGSKLNRHEPLWAGRIAIAREALFRLNGESVRHPLTAVGS